VSKRRIVLIAAAFLAVLLGGILLLLHDDEPHYRGRSLSRWLEAAERPGDQQIKGGEEALDALRHIGSNAVPKLIEWITYEPSRQEYEFRLSLQKLPAGLRPSLAPPGEVRSAISVYAFRMIGPDGRYAIPELRRILGTSTNLSCVGRCIHALFNIGPEGQAALLRIAANTNSLPMSRGYSVAILVGISSNDATAIPEMIPTLVECLHDKQIEVATSAAAVLGHLATSPSVTVPALSAALNDDRLQVRANAVSALGRYHEQAASALPALNRLLVDRNNELRFRTANAINQIKSAVDGQKSPEGAADELQSGRKAEAGRL
jgi:hypothetical protein